MSNDGLLARRDSRRMHPAVRQIAAEAAGEDPGPAVRRKSIDQVLTSVMDKKDKESIFDSPKLLNKHQRALSKGNTLTFQVGNYRIGSTIGKGRYSVVKLATHVCMRCLFLSHLNSKLESAALPPLCARKYDRCTNAVMYAHTCLEDNYLCEMLLCPRTEVCRCERVHICMGAHQ